jgi:O-antigen/teichoic acid export membrane protein
LIQAIMLVFESLWRVSYPAMARLLEAREDARPLLERGVAMAATATGFLAVAIGGSAPALVPTLFGSNWSDAAAIIPWAAVSLAVVGPVTACFAGYLYAVGDARTALRAAILHTAVWFATSLPLLPVIGVEAMGIGWLMSGIADSALLIRAVRRRTGIGVSRVLSPPGGAALLGIGAGLLVATTLPPNAVTLALSLITGEALYLGIILLVSRRALTSLLELLGRTVRPVDTSA